MSVCSSPREREKKRVVRARFPEKRLVIELIYIFIYTRCPLGTRLISNSSENSCFIGKTPNKLYTFSIQCYGKKLHHYFVFFQFERVKIEPGSKDPPPRPPPPRPFPYASDRRPRTSALSKAEGRSSPKMITRRSVPSLVANVAVGELISLGDSTNSSDVNAGSVLCATDPKVHHQPSIIHKLSLNLFILYTLIIQTPLTL